LAIGFDGRTGFADLPNDRGIVPPAGLGGTSGLSRRHSAAQVVFLPGATVFGRHRSGSNQSGAHRSGFRCHPAHALAKKANPLFTADLDSLLPVDFSFDFAAAFELAEREIVSRM
jgi:hypothetical protein